MAKATTEEAPRKARETLADLVVGEVKEDPTAFARTGLPDDHPLVVAFTQALEHKDDSSFAIRIDTPTPRVAERALRKLAGDRGFGVRVKHGDGFIAFKVTDKRTYNRGE